MLMIARSLAGGYRRGKRTPPLSIRGPVTEGLPFESIFTGLYCLVLIFERLVHGARGVLANSRHPVRVAVEGELYAGVSQQVLDVLGVRATSEHHREEPMRLS
jgi:hypothetical protein